MIISYNKLTKKCSYAPKMYYIFVLYYRKVLLNLDFIFF